MCHLKSCQLLYNGVGTTGVGTTSTTIPELGGYSRPTYNELIYVADKHSFYIYDRHVVSGFCA